MRSSYAGYGKFGNALVAGCAAIGIGALANVVGGLYSPEAAVSAGIVGAVVSAALILKDTKRVIQGTQGNRPLAGTTQGRMSGHV